MQTVQDPAAPSSRPLLKPVFHSYDYRNYLTHVIEMHRATRGFRSRLAEAAACQPSYLSQVLAGTASFSLDQLYGIGRYLQLGDVEWDYLRELGILDRAASKELRAACEARLATLRGQSGGAVAALAPQTDSKSLDDMVWYASSWQHGAVFNALSYEAARTPREVAAMLELPQARIEAVLIELGKRGFAGAVGDAWRPSAPMLYWNTGALYEMARLNYFVHGLHRRMSGYRGGLHVGGQTSMTREAFERWRGDIKTEFSRRMTDWAEPARKGGETVVYFGVDFFEM